MQRKILNTKRVRPGVHARSGREKLHSIPIIINKVKSSVLYGIPCVKSCACTFCILLVLGLLSIVIGSESCYALCNGTDGWCTGTISDANTISPLPTGGTTTPATASLATSNPNMTSSAITPGSTATVSTNVTVSVDNADSYSLSLKVDSTTLQNGNTTVTAGDVVSDNTWGYKWDGASTYTTPSTNGTTLTNSTLVPLDSNGAVSFTKNLTFGAKFSTSAEAGHYKGSGTLSLVATPKATSVLTLADLTQMQQLSLAPEACANTPYLSGQTYSAEYTLTDVRDNNTYTIRKFGDGKCWMTQNLRIWNKNADGDYYYQSGRVLKSSTSDISATTWTLPASGTSGFNDNTASNIYYNYSNSTGYYTWCAATAGTCGSATSGGQNASSSICPKGWKLPTGMVTGANTSNDFYNLFKNMNLAISGSLSATSSTSWGAGDLDIAQGSPYNFAYSGYVNNGSLRASSEGFWWSRTASSSNNAYNLTIRSGYMHPGTDSLSLRQYGFAVRCVAETPSASGGEATNPR